MWPPSSQSLTQVILFQAFISIIIILVFLGVVFYTWRLHGNLLAPPVVHGAGWILPPLLIAVPHRFQYGLRPITWFAIILSFLSFFLGYLFATRIKIFPHRNWRQSIEKIDLWNRCRFRVTLIILLIVFGIAFLVNLSNVLTTLGLDAYLNASFRTIEVTFGGVSPFINYLYFLNGLIIVYVVIYLKVYRPEPLVVTIGIVSLLSTLFFGHKSAIILPVILAIAASACVGLKWKARYIPVAFVIVVSSFMLVYFSAGNSPQNIVAEFLIILDRLVMYITPNYMNLQANIIHTTTPTLGVRTLSSVLRLLTLERITVQTPGYHLVDPAYNVGTYVLGYYLDYGWAGFIFPQFFIGIFSTYVYTWFLEKPSVPSITIYAVVITMNVMVFFSNYYLRIQFWWYIVVTIVLSAIVSQSTNPSWFIKGWNE
ncbi:O-antigen polymerase [Salarchaeum sp. JOR-1]|uniref:O-antigen polymerase n=1 Tax=Salarchaeum sp. JOR-1 TaxID=2599399 RepID=UPI0011983A41|nr:oligosaccharide repeat unit polymerase [Salarchaeum sp. JOR-1]